MSTITTDNKFTYENKPRNVMSIWNFEQHEKILTLTSASLTVFKKCIKIIILVAKAISIYVYESWTETQRQEKRQS